jgi:hypothetical protein
MSNILTSAPGQVWGIRNLFFRFVRRQYGGSAVRQARSTATRQAS